MMNKVLQFDIYERMMRIRKVQLAIEERYHLDEMKTPVHLCIGQEAVSAGVCAALHAADVVFSNHRGHGHYIARGGDLNAMIAELHCKESGCSKGRGGSMHLIDLSKGLIGSSSIVGGGIPLAVGAALSFQMKKQDRVSVVFFGDGASEEGVLYESMGFAALKKLPVVFVCENNFYSVCSHISRRQVNHHIAMRAKAFAIPTRRVDGSNAQAVYTAACAAVAAARRGNGPFFIECVTYRFRAHAGAGDEGKEAYRCMGEWKKEIAKDPLSIWKKKIGVSAAAQKKLDADIDAEIEKAFEFARNAPLPDKSELGRDVYFQESAGA